MRNRGESIKGCKERGEWAELCFMARAAEHGLRVSKPYGDSASYDVGVESKGRFLRVQVKSTIYRRRGIESYSLNVSGPRRQLYRKGTVDFFAVYLIPIDAWYIIPFGDIGGSFSLHFTAGSKRQKYEKYREAWHLLREATGTRRLCPYKGAVPPCMRGGWCGKACGRSCGR